MLLLSSLLWLLQIDLSPCLEQKCRPPIPRCSSQKVKCVNLGKLFAKVVCTQQTNPVHIILQSNPSVSVLSQTSTTRPRSSTCPTLQHRDTSCLLFLHPLHAILSKLPANSPTLISPLHSSCPSQFTSHLTPSHIQPILLHSTHNFSA